MKDTPRNRSRRSFLLAAAGGAAASAALIAKHGGDTEPGAQEKKTDSKGYQLTEHVRNYYRTARV